MLLRRTLEQTDRTAIVRFTLRQKTRLAALRVRGKVLVLQTLLWADEVREAAVPVAGRGRADLEEGTRAVGIPRRQLLRPTSIPSAFVDEYQKELRTLIDAKIEAGESFDVSATFAEADDEEKGGEVIDLMEALRASVARSKEKRTSRRRPRTRQEAGRRRPADRAS